jgi:DNA-binding NtrC family response regulator
MKEQRVLLADRDTDTRRLIADVLVKAGYEVKTTDSAVDVLGDLLKNRPHVVLVGSDFDEKIGAEDLIPLMKRCDRALTIILVSDEKPLPIMQKIRREGIFYHSLKPVNAQEGEEILDAVDCAFKSVLNVLSIR